MIKGYVQIYTGNGKGKTTASLGIAIRAAGAGHKVFIGQFTKGKPCSEHKALERFNDLITIKQYGEPGFISGNASSQDIALAKNALEELKQIVTSGAYDMVILEEANIATHYNLIDVAELLELIRNKPEHVEMIFTGRYADPKLVEAADLVTEMKEIKHYAKQGVPARIGIEK
jgi:cob(I)alamin adenosyltransferase